MADLTARLSSGAKALAVAVTELSRLASNTCSEEEADSVADTLKRLSEAIVREVAPYADAEHPLHMLHQQSCKVRACAETFVETMRAAKANPFDLSASQSSSAATAKLTHAIEKLLAMSERTSGRSSLNTAKGQSLPDVASIVRTTVGLSQDCGKALQSLQRAVADHDQEAFVISVREAVTVLNKLMAHSKANEFGAEGRLRIAAMRLGALSKAAFFSPTDRAAQESFAVAIRDTAHALRDILALSGVTVGGPNAPPTPTPPIAAAPPEQSTSPRDLISPRDGIRAPHHAPPARTPSTAALMLAKQKPPGSVSPLVSSMPAPLSPRESCQQPLSQQMPPPAQQLPPPGPHSSRWVAPMLPLNAVEERPETVLGEKPRPSTHPETSQSQASSSLAMSTTAEVIEYLVGKFPLLKGELSKLTPGSLRLMMADIDAIIARGNQRNARVSSTPDPMMGGGPNGDVRASVFSRRAASIMAPDMLQAELSAQAATEHAASLDKATAMLHSQIMEVLTTVKRVLHPDRSGRQSLDVFSVILGQTKDVVQVTLRYASSCVRHCERPGRGSVASGDQLSSTSVTTKRCESQSTTLFEKLLEDTVKALTSLNTKTADDAIISVSVGRDKKKVRDTLHMEIYRHAQQFRVMAGHLAGAEVALKSNPPEMREVVERGVAAVACIYTLSQLANLLSMQLETYQHISDVATDKIENEIEDAMDNVAPSQDIGHSTPLWKESVPIMLDSGGLFRAGTINHIVTRLTAEQHCDTKFTKACITTYQSFCTPRELLKKLIERYNAPMERLTKGLLEAIHLRVGVVLKYWIENQFEDFDKKTVEELLAFIDVIKRDGHTVLASALANEVAEKKSEIEKDVTVVVDDSQIRPAPYDNSIVEYILATSDDDIAQQLTLIDSELFRKIKSSELLNQNWSKKKARHKSPHVLAMIARSNRISFWVASCIVSQAFLYHRTKVVSKFITIAEALRKARNYNTLMSVIAGLTMSPVQRLQITFQALKPVHTALFQQLQDLMAPQFSFKTYREALRQQSTFAQPYLGTYLTDLTFTGDGNPDLVPNESGQQLINFKKRELVCTIISDLQMLQQTPCPYKRQEPLYTALLELPQCDENSLYNMSLQVEPRGAKRQDIL